MWLLGMTQNLIPGPGKKSPRNSFDVVIHLLGVLLTIANRVEGKGMKSDKWVRALTAFVFCLCC